MLTATYEIGQRQFSSIFYFYTASHAKFPKIELNKDMPSRPCRSFSVDLPNKLLRCWRRIFRSSFYSPSAAQIWPSPLTRLIGSSCSTCWSTHTHSPRRNTTRIWLVPMFYPPSHSPLIPPSSLHLLTKFNQIWSSCILLFVLVFVWSSYLLYCLHL